MATRVMMVTKFKDFDDVLRADKKKLVVRRSDEYMKTYSQETGIELEYFIRSNKRLNEKRRKE